MKKPSTSKIAIVSLFFVLFTLAIIARYEHYLNLQANWNQRHYILRDFLSNSDEMYVVVPWFRVVPTALLEIKNKNEIEELLSLIEFEEEFDISFWREPMLPKDHLKEVSFCMDFVHLEFYHSGSKLGHLWITPSCRELQFFPSNSFVGYYSRMGEQEILTKVSFEKIDSWFTQRGVDHYHNPLTPEQIINANKAGEVTASRSASSSTSL